MTWVKVCGLTRQQDVETAFAAGADAVGFVTLPDSPRRIPVDTVARLARISGGTRIVLTDDLDPDAAAELVERTGVDGIQPYGANRVATAQTLASTGLFVLFPLSPADLESGACPPGATPLVDAMGEGRRGGTGTAFRWEEVSGMPGDFVVAGGLGPENVAEAIRVTGAWGVDASSRLESGPGIKDPGRVAAFVKEAKFS